MPSAANAYVVAFHLWPVAGITLVVVCEHAAYSSVATLLHFWFITPAVVHVAAVSTVVSTMLCPLAEITVTSVVESQREQCFDFEPAVSHVAFVSTVNVAA